MTLKTLHYQVGLHSFRIANFSDFHVAEALSSFTPFLTPAKADKDIIFELRIDEAEVRGESLSPAPGDICFEWDDAGCLIRPLPGKAYLIYLTPRLTKQTFCMECSDGFRHCTAHLPARGDTSPGARKRNTTSFVLNNFLMMLYAFNAARHHTLLMHASVIVREGKAFLFLGKSGTGKSTHTSLWLKHIPDCYLLNDDNPVVHVDEKSKEVTVSGSPWSGKTPCYLNESVPAGAFIRLEQAPENEMKRENTVRAFASLLPSCSCLKQDKEINGAIVSTVTDLATLARVYHLKCLPDKGAVELCQRTVKE